MPKPVLVGIGGGSASGKTTITAALRADLEAAGHTVAVVACDTHMFRDIDRGPSLVLEATGEPMFDCNRPESVDWEAALTEIDDRVREAPDIVLVEGMMVLLIDAVRERLDLRLFVELDADERALRRLIRDLANPRGLPDPEQIAGYYRQSARGGHYHFVEPSRVYADLILRGDAPAERLLPLLRAAVEQLLARRPAEPLGTVSSDG